jgi:hypothetical protein
MEIIKTYKYENIYDFIWNDGGFLFTFQNIFIGMYNINKKPYTYPEIFDGYGAPVTILPITNEIILCLITNELRILIKNNDDKKETEWFLMKEMRGCAKNIFWTRNGSLIQVTERKITTIYLPEISLLKLIPLGLIAENTNWSNFLKEEPYDPRLFLFIAEFFRDPLLMDKHEMDKK